MFVITSSMPNNFQYQNMIHTLNKNTMKKKKKRKKKEIYLAKDLAGVEKEADLDGGIGEESESAKKRKKI
jgi:hypothetical protein